MRSIDEIKAEIAKMKQTLAEDKLTDFRRFNLEESISQRENSLRLAIIYGIPLDQLKTYCDAIRDGRCVILDEEGEDEETRNE
jgi:hypothetical protein